MNRSSVRIITAYSGNPYGDMAWALLESVDKFDYNYARYVISTDNPARSKLNKAELLLDAFEEGYEWVVWMDADSLMLQDIDALFGDWDIGLAVKEPEFRSSKFGSYFYSGLVVVRNSDVGKMVLREWNVNCKLEGVKSDQKRLNMLFEHALDDNIYGMVGETIVVDGIEINCIDPHVYVHQEAIRKMEAPGSDVRVLHFKGVLQKVWDEYLERFCVSS